MRFAVVQHRLRDTAAEDAAALVAAAGRAVDGGADVVVLPEVFSLSDGPERDALDVGLEPLLGRVAILIPQAGQACVGQAWPPEALPGLEEAGAVSLIVGDAFIDPAEIARLAHLRPSAIIAAPRSESDLQAEAALELAIGLSDAVTALVVVAEPSGAEPGKPGHGGSAIVLLGEVVAEATEDDEVLTADIVLPLMPPESRGPIPGVPTILQQRLAHHRGERMAVDYPADLS